MFFNGEAEAPVNAGTYTVTVRAKGNYRGEASAMFTIKKAKISGLGITQDGTVYGTVLPDAVTDQGPAGTTVGVRYSTSDGSKPGEAGRYRVTAIWTGTNYETFEASFDFEIEKKELKVKADNATREYGEANPEFALIYDGFAAGEDETVLFAEPVAVCEAKATSPAGEYSIAVRGGSADNYKFIYDNSGILTVTASTGGNFYITGAMTNVLVGDMFTLRRLLRKCASQGYLVYRR